MSISSSERFLVAVLPLFFVSAYVCPRDPPPATARSSRITDSINDGGAAVVVGDNPPVIHISSRDGIFSVKSVAKRIYHCVQTLSDPQTPWRIAKTQAHMNLQR